MAAIVQDHTLDRRTETMPKKKRVRDTSPSPPPQRSGRRHGASSNRRVATVKSTALPSQSTHGKDTRDVVFFAPTTLASAFFLESYGHCEFQIASALPDVRPVFRGLLREEDQRNSALPTAIAAILERERRWTRPGQLVAIVVAPKVCPLMCSVSMRYCPFSGVVQRTPGSSRPSRR